MPANGQGLTRILLQSLWPSGAHPQTLLGRFAGDELMLCVAPDMDRDWNRRPSESGAAFEHRIACDICEARGLPKPPPPEEIEETGEADERVERRTRFKLTSPGRRGGTPHHSGPRKAAISSA